MEQVITGLGRVVQVQGSVVDVEFPADNLPEMYEAIEVQTPGEARSRFGSAKIPG